MQDSDEKAMRHFWKIANRAGMTCAGKFFVKKPVNELSVELKFSRMEIR
jgi:hypothetical protein